MYKRQAASHNDAARNLVLVDGVITCLLGGLVLAEWPSDTLWAIGTLFGVALMISALRMFTTPGGDGASAG